MFWFGTRKRARELFDRGRHLQKDFPREASYLLAQSAALVPSQRTYLYLGACLEGLGDLELAADAYSNAKMAGIAEPNHNTGVALNQQARLRIKQGHFEIAEKLARDALVFLTSEKPDAIADARLTHGITLWRLGRESEAQTEFEWVLTNSNNTEMQRLARSFQFTANITEKARGGLDSLLEHIEFLRDGNLT